MPLEGPERMDHTVGYSLVLVGLFPSLPSEFHLLFGKEPPRCQFLSDSEMPKQILDALWVAGAVSCHTRFEGGNRRRAFATRLARHRAFSHSATVADGAATASTENCVEIWPVA